MPTLDLELVAEGLQFPEGPVAMADGSVLVTEIAARRITRIARDGAKSHVADVRGPNGLAIGPDGALYVADNGGRFVFVRQEGMTVPTSAPPEHVGGSIERIDLKTGAATRLYDACEGRPLWAPNDLVFDADGGFWFTDHGTADEVGTKHGALYWARADGSKIVRARGHLHTPNGVGLSPDGKVVYVADTMSGRLWAYDIVGEGQLAPAPLGGSGRVIATLPGHQLFDSLAVEADGRVCVATILNGGITAITPEGEHEHFPVPDLITTNIAFGGGGMTTAWITASATGKLYKCCWPRPGLRLNFNA